MIKTFQKSGKIRLPEGRKVAVAICCAFEGQAVYTNDSGQTTPYLASYGENDAEMCVPRIMDALEKYNIHSTFFIPGHTVDTYPDLCREIAAKGHELACEGYSPRDIQSMEAAEEERLLQLAIRSMEKIGVKPKGFRTPSCTISENTLPLLEKYGFLYDSSLMGNDLTPYYPRPVTFVDDKSPVKFGEPYKILEMPRSLHLDNYPFYEHTCRDPLLPHYDAEPLEELQKRCEDTYEYACRFDGSMMMLTIHTYGAGQRCNIRDFEKLLKYFADHDAWFATCAELAESVNPESFE